MTSSGWTMGFRKDDRFRIIRTWCTREHRLFGYVVRVQNGHYVFGWVPKMLCVQNEAREEIAEAEWNLEFGRAYRRAECRNVYQKNVLREIRSIKNDHTLHGLLHWIYTNLFIFIHFYEFRALLLSHSLVEREVMRSFTRLVLALLLFRWTVFCNYNRVISLIRF